MRHQDWEARLNAALAKHRDAPGKWGASDCWMLATDAHEAVTGRALLPDLRGYKTERGGFRLFAKHGFSTVGEALASALPEVGRLQAMRGDLAVIERGGVESCVVVASPNCVSKTLSGLAYLPQTEIKRAFRVE